MDGNFNQKVGRLVTENVVSRKKKKGFFFFSLLLLLEYLGWFCRSFTKNSTELL